MASFCSRRGRRVRSSRDEVVKGGKTSSAISQHLLPLATPKTTSGSTAQHRHRHWQPLHRLTASPPPPHRRRCQPILLANCFMAKPSALCGDVLGHGHWRLSCCCCSSSCCCSCCCCSSCKCNCNRQLAIGEMLAKIMQLSESASPTGSHVCCQRSCRYSLPPCLTLLCTAFCSTVSYFSLSLSPSLFLSFCLSLLGFFLAKVLCLAAQRKKQLN